VFGLDAHECVHADGILDQPAGVDADVLHRPEPSITILTIARDARHVSHDGVTRFRQRIE
jgi:hypothetical protein